MNKIIIVDASDSDCSLMSGLLTRAGYEPIAVGEMEAAKQEVAKLSPGAVIVSAMTGSYPARVSKPDISRQSESEASTIIILFIISDFNIELFFCLIYNILYS